jgi:hypothetical protein
LKIQKRPPSMLKIIDGGPPGGVPPSKLKNVDGGPPGGDGAKKLPRGVGE